MTEPGSFAERPARSTGQARESIVPSWITAWLEPFAAAFEACPVFGRVRAVEIAAVLAILAAGAVLRFWGLGAVGLHGDEKTMALPTMHLVHFGTPLFPSGLHYVRAIGQLYLMAAAIGAFGQSAWAFRLPSAICGILLIGLAYLAGRRFLTAPWNLAFTAAVAFLPGFIEDAQTARMYVFLVTCVAGYVVLLFEWERTGRDVWLAAATLVLVIGIQFQQLAIFAAFLTLYPGLLRSDARKLLAGLVAFVVIAASFELISYWIASTYPNTVVLPSTPHVIEGPRAAALATHPRLLVLVPAAVILGGLGVWLSRALPARATSIVAAALLALVPFAQFLDAYHVAFILAVAGVIAAGRATAAAPAWSGASAASGARAFPATLSFDRAAWARRLGILALVCALVLAVQLILLAKAGVPVRQRFGVLLGWPSVWPFIAISDFSRVAALVTLAALGVAGWRLARRERIPDFFLFLALGVWIPLLMIGLFKWSIPPRYAEAQVFPLLLGAFAGAQWLVRRALRRTAGAPPLLRWQAAAAGLLAILAIDPVSLAHSVDAGYGEHPDHLGAARFILAQHLGPKDIVIAEDVVMQTYYLGHVDYWLIGKALASQDFVYWRDGRYEDIYTDTPVITSASELERLIARRDRGAIYIIGSGELQQDGRAYARGPSLERFLTSPRLRVVYRGRDGLTRVWKIPAPSTSGSVARAG